MAKTTNGHKNESKNATPCPTLPPGFKRLRMYPPVWRGAPGDSIKGAILAVEPIVMPDGSDCNAVMWCVSEPTPVHRYSARGDGVDDTDGPGAQAPNAHKGESVAVPVRKFGDIGRLMTYGEQASHPESELAQLGELHAVGMADGSIRYECFIARVPAKRADVDPRVKLAMEEATRKAALQRS